MTINELYAAIIDHGIAQGDELDLVTDIAGYSIDTLENVIYSRTGYPNLDSFLEG